MVELLTSTAELPLSFWTALARGLACRCPHCGKGKIFASFLKAHHHCSACGEEFFHHRADDMPAYIVILIAGHLVVPLVAFVEIHYSPSYWLHAALWIPLCLTLCIGLLQPVKGAVIAVQWFNGMHDFLSAKMRRLERRASLSTPPNLN